MAAQNLLNHYVRIQGLAVSQLIRKSVETRDWLHTMEPRSVRIVMKRVVEDITAIDSQVAALYDDVDGQVDRSSDSSRKTHRYIRKTRSVISSFPIQFNVFIVTLFQREYIKASL